MKLNLVLHGRPITKKNHSRIFTRPFPRLVPSEVYLAYEEDCLYQLLGQNQGINDKINLKCVYYMPTRHKVDLCNLLAATCDILVEAGVIEDDNSRIVVSHDGSRVEYDKENPRVEIEIRSEE